MGSVEIDGQWYKRCMACSEYVNFDELGYVDPTEAWPFGLDVCPGCYELDGDALQAVIDRMATARRRANEDPAVVEAEAAFEAEFGGTMTFTENDDGSISCWSPPGYTEATMRVARIRDEAIERHLAEARATP